MGLERKSVIVIRVGVRVFLYIPFRMYRRLYKFFRSLILEVLRLLFQHPTPIRLALASSLLPDISLCLHPSHRFILHAIQLPRTFLPQHKREEFGSGTISRIFKYPWNFLTYLPLQNNNLYIPRTFQNILW
jgi:hypothetical protein